jgi:uncharacterized protein
MPTVERMLEPVPFTAVNIEDAFWAPRIEVNRAVSIPHIYEQCETTGRISAFDLDFRRPLPAPMPLVFGDSDPAKWLEAACYSLATHPDPELRARVERVAGKIIHAQQPDGYLNTHFIAAQPDMRWRNLRDFHEMYCAGHLIEAAVAHQQATGQNHLLDALIRYADHIDALFGREPGKKHGYCGHPEIELALVKLYHATNNPRYLNLASYFVDERGRQPHYYDLEAHERGEDPADFWAKSYEYCQAHAPLREQAKVVGHAVRAMYLLSAAADLAGAKHDPRLRSTCERLWDNLINRRMYLTGAIGPSRDNEGFTLDYDLPDETAYGETCATIGLIFWNHRLLQLTGESKYADVVERGLYNGFLSGVSLDGTRFFYENPLASRGGHHRQGWFEIPCCPPNLARVLASLGGYFYSTGENDVWVHLYAQGSVKLTVSGTPVALKQITRYPWDGDVSLGLDVAAPRRFCLHLRVPGWCESWSLRVNGEAVSNPLLEANGYLAIDREWRSGDAVEFRMEMPIQTIWANPEVKLLQKRIALQRGPIVYCLEGVDHNGIDLEKLSLDAQRVHTGEFGIEHRRDMLGGVTVIHGRAELVEDPGWAGKLYRSHKPVYGETEIMAIPYFAWDNRMPGQMRVWIGER